MQLHEEYGADRHGRDPNANSPAVPLPVASDVGCFRITGRFLRYLALNWGNGTPAKIALPVSLGGGGRGKACVSG